MSARPGFDAVSVQELILSVMFWEDLGTDITGTF